MKAIALTVSILLLLVFAAIWGSGYLVSDQQNLQKVVTEQAETIAQLEAALAEQVQTNNGLQADLIRLEAEHTGLQARYEAAASELAQSQAAAAAYETRIAELSLQAAAAQEQLRTAGEQVQECGAQITILSARLEDARAALAEAKARLAEKTAQVKIPLLGMELGGEISPAVVTAAVLLSVLSTAGMGTIRRLTKGQNRRDANVRQQQAHLQQACWSSPRYRQMRRERARKMERRSRQMRNFP
jgi:septal ring factor EnvC (AmiA/AmiB activator)